MRSAFLIADALVFTVDGKRLQALVCTHLQTLPMTALQIDKTFYRLGDAPIDDHPDSHDAALTSSQFHSRIFGSERRRMAMLLAGSVVLYVISRLLFLYFLHPLFSFFYIEEPYRGTIAVEMLRHGPMPWLAFRADDYSGGSLVVGYLASWFFRLFGTTAIALKTVALLFGAGTLLSWMLLVVRQRSRREAAYLALLFIFAPPLWVRFSTTVMGFHSESCFFTALTLWVFFELWEGRQTSPWAYAVLGGFAGFGLWFTYIYALTLATFGAFVACRGFGRLKRRGLMLSLVLFALGFSPWLRNNIWGSVHGMAIGSYPVWKHFSLREGLSSFCHWHKTPLFLLAISFASDDWLLIGGGKPNLVYSLWFIALAASLIYRSRQKVFGTDWLKSVDPRISFALLYIGLFLAAMTFSDFKDLRYRVVLEPFLFFLAAAMISSVGKVAHPRNGPVVTSIFLGTFIALCLLYNSAFCSWLYAGRLWTVKAYTYLCMPPAACSSMDSCQAYYSAMAAGLGEADRADLAAGVSEAIAEFAETENVRDLFSRIWPRDRFMYGPEFYYRLARLRMFQNADELGRAITFLETWRHGPFYRAALIGLANSLEYKPYFQGIDRQAFEKRIERMPAGEAASFWRGLGYQAGEEFRLPNHVDGPAVERLLNPLPPAAREPFVQGIGIFVFDQWNNNPLYQTISSESLRQWPDSLRHGLYQGMGMAWARYAPLAFADERRWRPAMLEEWLGPDVRDSFWEGDQQFRKSLL